MLAPMPSVFVSVQLFTELGEYVTTAYLPPFSAPPEILVWGTRFFRRETSVQCVYREAFTYFVPPGYVG